MNSNSRQLSCPTPAVLLAHLAEPDPQVRYRLIRMKKELGTVQKSVVEFNRPVPASEASTKELQNQFKMLKSKRKAMEDEVPTLSTLCALRRHQRMHSRDAGTQLLE